MDQPASGGHTHTTMAPLLASPQVCCLQLEWAPRRATARRGLSPAWLAGTLGGQSKQNDLQPQQSMYCMAKWKLSFRIPLVGYSAKQNSHPMGYVNKRTAVANSIIWCYFSLQLSIVPFDPALSKYRHLPPGNVQTVSLIWNQSVCIKSLLLNVYQCIFYCCFFFFFTGSGKPPSYYYSSPTREEPRRTQVNINYSK